MPSIPHSNSKDLPPNSRKMIVLQEYTPQDNQGLMVKRGESVWFIRQDGNWLFVRNEWGREGHVPSSHLIAPYSSMRSWSRRSGNHPIRSIASGSSMVSSDVNSSFRSSRGGVPVHTSQSAGRPRKFSSSDNHRVDSRRVVSLPSLSQNAKDAATQENIGRGLTTSRGSENKLLSSALSCRPIHSSDCVPFMHGSPSLLPSVGHSRIQGSGRSRHPPAPYETVVTVCNGVVTETTEC